ncbi:late embryogenesis abundant protein D-34-like [Actinidia eriantha]|uniref:late embryogenesis abundant protein D-34-like n=1 Tax=Actinidia eriantha TaxID=165200 RepID=UPI00258A322A|nr:late embryogenesis abundant protein D-34-like [Actinidia eriantha]
MSQEQPRRPQDVFPEQEPIKYGDVFQVSGDLADKPIVPQDADMMQTAEASVFGQPQVGGPASVMQAAATVNERAGLVSDVSNVAGDIGVAVSARDYPGTHVITESVAGQVVGQYYQGVEQTASTVGGAVIQTKITIGEALEATARTAGNKPVDQSDAAAIQAAEARATGTHFITPGGVAADAQSAADFNAGLDRDEDKIKLSDVLSDATEKLPADKPVSMEDTEGVMTAEMRNNPNLTTNPIGVAASMAAAAKLNEGDPA